jgi:hypothetical protein
MLRITATTGGELLKLEGKLLGPWVGELARACDRPRPPRLDLAGLTFADAAGARLLRELLVRGATVAGSSTFIAELLRLEDR